MGTANAAKPQLLLISTALLAIYIKDYTRITDLFFLFVNANCGKALVS